MLKYHIQTVELTSAQAQISFNSIPQTFTDLYVSVSARTTGTGSTLNITFNENTTGYTNRTLQGNGSSSSSFANFNRYAGIIGISSETSNTFGSSNIYISNYTTSANKSYSSDCISENNATTAYQAIIAGLWSNSSPITSVTFTPLEGTFVAGSTISLYGVRRGDSKETASATGGTVTTSGGYTIHTFNSSGTFAVSRPLEVEYLVVAGGGGGSTLAGGGGGAGGYRLSVPEELSGGRSPAEPKIVLSAGIAYNVIVGAGGAGATTDGTNGVSGSQSSFGSIVSVGGGAGVHVGSNSITGGSGGGAGYNSGTGGPGTSNQGYKGGDTSGGATSPNYPAAGGGGSGSVGGNATASNGGVGGSGSGSSITGTFVTRAGGGGGSFGTTGAAGGSGGGGQGGGIFSGTLSTSGTANTGSGGGGGRSAGSGGSGVVIIRYPTP